MAEEGINEMDDPTGGIYFGEPGKGGPTDIKFYNARTSDNPILFKAFLTSFSDKYTSNWNETTVYARMDPIYTYQNTTRAISFGIDVPAYGIIEAQQNLIKFSNLVKLVYPTYSSPETGHGITNSPVVGIKFGNLISDASGVNSRGLFGYLGGVEVTPDIEAGFFMSSENSEKFGMYPKLLKASFDFKPLHNHLVGDAPGNESFANFPYGMGSNAGDFGAQGEIDNATARAALAGILAGNA